MNDESSRPVVSRSVAKNPAVHSYKDLIVWKKSLMLSIMVYGATKAFPRDEVYGLSSQVRRCAVSIPSNIAEGYTRHGRKEFLQFLQIAFASGAELETQLLISRELRYIDNGKFGELELLLQEVQKMLNSLIAKLKNK